MIDILQSFLTVEDESSVVEMMIDGEEVAGPSNGGVIGDIVEVGTECGVAMEVVEAGD